MRVSDLLDFFQTTAGKVAAVAAGILLIWILVQLGKRTLGKRIADTDTRYRARKLVTFVGILAAALLITTVFADRLSGLTLALGAASAGVAFALQEVIVSVAGWLAIMSGKVYRVGDRIQLGKTVGDVIDVSVLRTTLMECGEWVKGDLYTGRIVRVANSFVFKDPVYNYSQDYQFLWDEIRVPIKFGSNYERARQILDEAVTEVTREYVDSARAQWAKMLTSYRLEPARVEPMVTMIFNDNWVEFTVRYVTDFQRRRFTKDALFTRVLTAIENTGDEVALASATFHLVEAPVFQVSFPDERRETPAA